MLGHRFWGTLMGLMLLVLIYLLSLRGTVIDGRSITIIGGIILFIMIIIFLINYYRRNN